MRKPTSYRLSEEALEMLASLAKRLGLSLASTLELAIRTLSDIKVGGPK